MCNCPPKDPIQEPKSPQLTRMYLKKFKSIENINLSIDLPVDEKLDERVSNTPSHVYNRSYSNSSYSSYSSTGSNSSDSSGKCNFRNRHMVYRHKMRGITQSVMGNGVARIVFNGRAGFKGILVTDNDETIAIQGTCENPKDELMSTDPSVPSTSQMLLSVVEAETGIKFKLASVPVEFIPTKNSKTNIVYSYVRIEHHCISFKTDEILIGNRADMEIQHYLDPNIVNADPPSHIAQAKSLASGKRVHVGRMTLKVVASQKIEETPRKESICMDCSTEIIEQSQDFLS